MTIQNLEAFHIVDTENIYKKLHLITGEKADHWQKLLLTNRDSDWIMLEEKNEVIASAQVIFNPTDSAVFGHKIASLVSLAIHKDRDLKLVLSQFFKTIIKRCNLKYDLLTILIDFDEYEIVEALQNIGAKICGGNITWSGNLSKMDLNALYCGSWNSANDLNNSEKTKLFDLVKESYSQYKSHYSFDSKINPKNCALSYMEKVKAHVEDGGIIELTMKQSEIAAFSTINLHQKFNTFLGTKKVGEIEISGINHKTATIDAYQASLVQGFNKLKKMGFSTVLCGCSINNFAVQKIWIKIKNFTPKLYRHRFHWWLS